MYSLLFFFFSTNCVERIFFTFFFFSILEQLSKSFTIFSRSFSTLANNAWSTLDVSMVIQLYIVISCNSICSIICKFLPLWLGCVLIILILNWVVLLEFEDCLYKLKLWYWWLKNVYLFNLIILANKKLYNNYFKYCEIFLTVNININYFIIKKLTRLV